MIPQQCNQQNPEYEKICKTIQFLQQINCNREKVKENSQNETYTYQLNVDFGSWINKTSVKKKNKPDLFLINMYTNWMFDDIKEFL